MKVQVAGAEPDEAQLVVILLHGRGGNADNMLSLSAQFEADEVCWLAPVAMNGSWFPGQVDEPRSSQEPFLTLSMQSILGLIEKFGAKRVILAGFGQGACLVCELLIHFPGQYAGAWVFSGAAVGTPEDLPEKLGTLAKTSVVHTGSLQDPQVSGEKMKETTQLMKQMGAELTTLFSEEQSHSISGEELHLAKSQLNEAIQSAERRS